MRFFCTLADWLVQRLFWLCVLGATSVAHADVILYQQSWDTSQPGPQVNGGEIRWQQVDLATAARLERLRFALEPSGEPTDISVWLSRSVGQRETLLYSGPTTFRDWWQTVSDIQRGRSWVGVEVLTGSKPMSLRLAQGTGNGAFTSTNGTTTATDGYAIQLRGTPVPEPAGLVPVAIVVGIVGAGIVWRRVGR
jgi:hypothetical protein